MLGRISLGSVTSIFSSNLALSGDAGSSPRVESSPVAMGHAQLRSQAAGLPTLRGTLDTPGDTQDVVVKGTRAFIADGTSGLRVIDVSNLVAPVVIGSIDTPGAGLGVDVSQDGMIAVIVDGTAGLQIINLTDAMHPAIIGSLVGGDARDVVINGNFVFVAAFARSFTSVDISAPRSPAPRGVEALLSLAVKAHRKTPVPSFPTNGDEDAYPTKIASYTKGLPHNERGEVDLPAHSVFLRFSTSV